MFNKDKKRYNNKKIQKEKNIIIKGKIDIAVLIFMISTSIL